MKFEFERQMKIYKDLLDQAENYEQNYRWEQAYNILLNAEKIVKKYGSKLEIGRIYLRKGRILSIKGNLKDGLSAFKDSLKFFKKTSALPVQIAEVKDAIGNAYKVNGMIKNALEAYKEALKILQAEKERVIYTHSHLTNSILQAIAHQLNNIGEMHLLLNEEEDALENCRESLKTALDTKTASIILKSRLALAKIYTKQRQYEMALEYLNKSLVIAQKENEHLELLNIMIEIGNNYNNQKNYKFSLENYKKALNLSKKLEDKQKLILLLDKIGTIYLKLNNKKKAAEHFEKSYEISNETNQYYFEYLLYHLGLLHFTNGEHDKAYEFFKESVEFAKKTHNTIIHISALLKIGDILYSREKYDDSIYYYKKLLEFNSDLDIQMKVLNKIGLSNLALNNLESANEYFLKCFSILRILLLGEHNFEKRVSIMNKYFDIPYNLCATNCYLFKKSGDYHFLTEALGYSEFNHFQKNSSSNRYSEKIQIDKIEKVQVQIKKSYKEWKDMLNEFNLERNQKDREKLKKQIDDKQQLLFELEDQLRDASNGLLESFTTILEQFKNNIFEKCGNSNHSSAILEIIIINSLHAIFIILIDLERKELLLFFREFNKKLPNLIQNKLQQLNTTKIKESKVKIEKIQASLNNLWDKLMPKELSTHLINQKYQNLALIPQSFLFNLPWETMQFKNKLMNQLFHLTIYQSLYEFLNQNN